jgi:hypothetical protein
MISIFARTAVATTTKGEGASRIMSFDKIAEEERY